MASFNTELKRKGSTLNATFDDTYYVKTTWGLVDGKPATYTPTAHNHAAGDINSGTFDTARIPILAQSKITNLSTDLANRIVYNDTIMNTNPFGGRKLYINSIDNAMHAADKKWWVTITKHLKVYNSQSYPLLNPNYVAEYTITGSGTSRTITNTPKPSNIVVYENDTLKYETTHYTYNSGTGLITFTYTPSGTLYIYPGHQITQYLDSPVVSTLSSSQPFDGSYETSASTGDENHYIKVRITTDSSGYRPFINDLSYSYGDIFLSYYHVATCDKAEYRVYNYSFRPHVVGWKKIDFTDFIGTKGSSSYIQSVTDNGNHGRSVMEFIIYGDTKTGYAGAWLTQIDWKLSRPNLQNSGSTVTKFGNNKLYGNLSFGDRSGDNIIINSAGSISIGGNNVILEGDTRLANERTPSNHNLIDSTKHPVSGLTSGHFLKALGPTTYGFAAHGLNAAAVGARASDWVPAWGDVTGKPTTFAPIIGSGSNEAVAGNDSRLTNDRPASDVYSWAKAATKPTYTADEVGAASKNNSMYYVLGNSGGTAGVWTGIISDITGSIPVGTCIAYHIRTAGVSGGTTLNINSQGAVACRINNSTLTTHFTTESVIFLAYDGTYWKTFDYNTNTTYSAITQLEIENSANTTARLITGERFKQGIDKYIASWAQGANKPTYNAGEVGALAASGGTLTGPLGIGRDVSSSTKLDIQLTGTGEYILFDNTDSTNNTNAVFRVNSRSTLGNTFRIQRDGKTIATELYEGNNRVFSAGNTNIGTGSTNYKAGNYTPSKAEIEAVLTGEITSHTHDLPIIDKTADYGPVLGEQGRIFSMNNTAARSFFINTNTNQAFPVGSELHFVRYGSGDVEIYPDTGVTILSEGSKKKINAQYQVVTLKKTATNTWLLFGALKS